MSFVVALGRTYLRTKKCRFLTASKLARSGPTSDIIVGVMMMMMIGGGESNF